MHKLQEVLQLVGGRGDGKELIDKASRSCKITLKNLGHEPRGVWIVYLAISAHSRRKVPVQSVPTLPVIGINIFIQEPGRV